MADIFSQSINITSSGGIFQVPKKIDYVEFSFAPYGLTLTNNVFINFIGPSVASQRILVVFKGHAVFGNYRVKFPAANFDFTPYLNMNEATFLVVYNKDTAKWVVSFMQSEQTQIWHSPSVREYIAWLTFSDSTNTVGQYIVKSTLSSPFSFTKIAPGVYQGTTLDEFWNMTFAKRIVINPWARCRGLVGGVTLKWVDVHFLISNISEVLCFIYDPDVPNTTIDVTLYVHPLHLALNSAGL